MSYQERQTRHCQACGDDVIVTVSVIDAYPDIIVREIVMQACPSCGADPDQLVKP